MPPTPPLPATSTATAIATKPKSRTQLHGVRQIAPINRESLRLKETHPSSGGSYLIEATTSARPAPGSPICFLLKQPQHWVPYPPPVLRRMGITDASHQIRAKHEPRPLQSGPPTVSQPQTQGALSFLRCWRMAEYPQSGPHPPLKPTPSSPRIPAPPLNPTKQATNADEDSGQPCP